MAPSDPLERLAARVGRRLHARGVRVATAESCTAGWIAKALTDVAGSSAWYECGWVTYSNAAKMRDLGVAAAALARHGAVSEAVVRQMARGALRRSGAGVAIAVSGIAGPGGGSPGKPVGTVWFGLASRVRGRRQPAVSAQVRRFAGDRAAVRRRAVRFALRLLLTNPT